MPDLQSELSKVLNDWNTDDAPTTTQPTKETAMTNTTPTPVPTVDNRIKSNVSRASFYLVRDNPGLTRDEAVTKLIEQGHKAVSATSLLGQMLRARMIMQDANGKLSAVVRDYEPLTVLRKTKTKVKAKAAKPVKAATDRKQITIVSRETGEVLNPKLVEPIATPVPTTMQTAESVLASMSVAEAHKLWVALNKMFGG